jgi:DNA-binding IclR family transcriptional regulator
MPVEAWHVWRTMRLLELLAFAPLSAPQLAEALYAQPRTVRRVLGRLVDEGYVTLRDERSRVYSPTMRLVALAGQIVENSTLVHDARPHVVLLHERTGAAAHLVVPSYGSVLCLLHAGEAGDHVRPRLREVVPAHCTAGGKVLLAWRDRWRDSVLSRALTRYTDQTTVDPSRLREQLERIRVDGYALEEGEYQLGVRAVAAAVVINGEAIAALTATGYELDCDQVLGAVLQTAAELREHLERGEA